MTPTEGKEKLKIFSMNDCDYMAAETLDEAKKEYAANWSGMGHDDDKDMFDDPGEITPIQYEKLLFHDEDGKVRSFREQLQLLIDKGEKFPTFFASTEY